jgi:DNA-binding MarR family transcriptional regulator
MVESSESNSRGAQLSGLADAVSGTAARWRDATEAYDEAVGARLSLNGAERRALAFLLGGPRPAGAIAEATRLTPAAVTALIDRLERRTLVRRARDADDRRKVMVEMTDEARKLAADYHEPLADEEGRFLAGFTGSELAIILRFLEGATEVQERYLEALRASAPGRVALAT